ncbi:FliH/SctL family protein [Salinarimonas chemoclinalis]|uniref:FliH/SctL family protein n=1 Tax=Salinarimonas chemoclinalis TaxID=3241599 RepID=UPI0035578858
MSAGSDVFTPRRRVLDPEEMRAVTEATAYLGRARDLQAKLEAKTGQAVTDGREQGFREGYAAGRRAALEDFADAVKRARERLTASDEELAAIVLVAVERMLGPRDERELARACVRHALAEAADDIWAVLRVPAEDHQVFVEDLAAVSLSDTWPEIRGVEADPLLRPGEIVLETPKGRIHVGLKQQLSRLKAGLQNVEG